MEWNVFGTVDGQQAYVFTFPHEATQLSFSDYGGTLVDWLDVRTNRHIALGYDTVEAYHANGGHLGATVGPVANRIAQATYQWNGTTVKVEANQSPNSLHSGKANIGHHLWHTISLEGYEVNGTNSEVTGISDWETLCDGLLHQRSEAWQKDHHHLVNAWHSPQREQDHRTPLGVWGIISRCEDSGFPSDVYIYMAVYREGTTVDVVYHYISMHDTFVNLTNHSYFNLQGTGDVRSHEVMIPSPYYMPYGDHQIVRPEKASVEGTAFDFRDPQELGSMLDTWQEELAPYKGYDHDYVVEGADMPLLGTFRVPDMTLSFYSDSPHMQFYTGNWLHAERRGGEVYTQWSGMCIEPQFIPNDINMDGYGESYVTASQWYRRSIRYVVTHE